MLRHAREDFGVASLVIVGGVGKRNQNAGQLEGSDLGQTGRARARDREIGGAVNFFHVVMKTRRTKAGIRSRR